jgi:membrane fusion protein, heavy metal efflux system
VSISGDAPSGAVTIPASALTKIGGKDIVFVAKGNRFALREVTAVAAGTGDVLITSGLQPGERIATSGLTELKMFAGGA